MTTLEKVRKAILDNSMITGGDVVAVGFSGGTDSLAMTLLLQRLSEELDFRIILFHVNHHIRGKAADEDAEAALSFAKEAGSDAFILDVDAPAYAAAHTGVSLEEAARILRYRALYDAAVQHKAASIAAAHHMDDLCETVLFRLCRGTGPAGLNAMKPVSTEFPCGISENENNIRLIRPLLSCTRKELEEIVADSPYQVREDETNSDEDITRNAIRKRIIPALLEINENAVQHIVFAAQKSGENQEYIDNEAEKLFGEAPESLDRKKLSSAPAPVGEAAVRLFLKAHLPGMRDIGQAQIKAVLSSADPSKPPEMRTDLKGGWYALTDYDCVRICPPSSDGLSESDSEDIGRKNTGRFSFSILEGEVAKELVSGEIPRKTYTKYFDYDRIKGNFPVQRTAESDDFIVIGSGGEKTSLRRFFINEKIPKEKREVFPLLCDGHSVMWVPGYRDSYAYRLTPQTVKILVVKFEGELPYARTGRTHTDDASGGGA